MNDKVLLIGDDTADADLIKEALAEARDGLFDFEWVRQLSDGLDRLGKGGIEVVLLDLFLPDNQGIDTFDKLFLAAPYIPILLLSSLDHEDIARQAVKQGAQDYLLKSHLDSYWLPRALRYVIGRKAAEEALFMERERAQVTLNSIGDAVLSTDINGNVTYLNLVAEKMTGWSREEASGRPLAEVFQIIDAETRKPAQDPMELAIRQNKTVSMSANCLLIARNGSESAIEDSAAPIHDRGGKIIGAVIVFHDASQARAMVLRMSYLAQHDLLTNLPNRLLLNDRLMQAIALAQRHGTQLAVLFLDLDRFKHINDSLGHAIGDQLLQSIAKRLTACVRNSDTISRHGGDEFVILLTNIEHAKDAARSAENVLAALTAPYALAQQDIHVTVSIGIGIYPDDGLDAESLLQSADTAMYHSKDNGRNNYQFFTQDMNTRAVERQSLESGLRRALERQEFVLHYQSKVNLETGAITGAEALIRWHHPGRGLVPPAQFVPIAEDCGLIIPIGRWMLYEACRQARAWQDASLRLVPVAVNISAVEFRAKDFLESVRAALEDTCLEPGYLELELTESVLMQDGEGADSVLQALKAMGVQLTIDDFGTGYSSLSYLKRFPIDVLKIDQSFVRDITSDPDNATIVSAVISMGKSLNQRVIAEGVETQEQLAFLQSQGCDEGQGYYFSRPVVAEEFARLLGTTVSRY